MGKKCYIFCPAVGNNSKLGSYIILEGPEQLNFIMMLLILHYACIFYNRIIGL